MIDALAMLLIGNLYVILIYLESKKDNKYEMDSYEMGKGRNPK